MLTLKQNLKRLQFCGSLVLNGLEEPSGGRLEKSTPVKVGKREGKCTPFWMGSG